MFKKNKIIMMAMLLAFVLVLAACGGGDANSSVAESTASTDAAGSANDVSNEADASEETSAAGSEEASTSEANVGAEESSAAASQEPTSTAPAGDADVAGILSHIDQQFTDVTTMTYKTTMSTSVTTKVADSSSSSKSVMEGVGSVDSNGNLMTTQSTTATSTSPNGDGEDQQTSTTTESTLYAMKNADGSYTQYTYMDADDQWVKQDVDGPSAGNSMSPVSNKNSQLAQYLTAIAPTTVDGIANQVIQLSGAVPYNVYTQVASGEAAEQAPQGSPTGDVDVVYTVDAATHQLLRLDIDMTKALNETLTSQSETSESSDALGIEFSVSYNELKVSMSDFQFTDVATVELPAEALSAISFDEYLSVPTVPAP